MKKYRRILVGILCFIILAGIYSPVTAQERDLEFEQEILDRLESIDPQAVPLFQQATQALDSGDFQTAIVTYDQVLELAPDFPDALRRLSYAELQLGMLDEALSHAQRAYDLDPSVINKMSLAESLAATERPINTSKALVLAQEVVQELPDDPQAYYVLMMAAYLQDDIETLRTACEALFRLSPEYPLSHYFYSLVMTEDGKWEQAERELLIARDLGVSADHIEQLLMESGIAKQARVYRIARWSGYGLAVWIGGMGILFLLGLLLSKSTLSAMKRAKILGTTSPSRKELRIRSIYRTVIGLVSAYFYISIPFIIVIFLAIGAGVVYFIIQAETFNRLILFILLMILYSLYAVIRGVFFRFKQGEPGRRLEPAEAPALWALTKAVAAELHTRPIEAIYLAPGTEIAVFEQGSVLSKSRGKGKRTLLLGLGILSGMTQGQIKSILAHEYSHFTGKDTAGGDLANRVLRSIQMIIIGLVNSGQAHNYNPAWWFISGFYKLFLRITLGASRLQETLADRSAAAAYGAQNFIDGLRHVIRQSIHFDLQTQFEIQQAITNRSTLNNLYSLPDLSSTETIQTLENSYQDAFSRKTSTYDSHPSPSERCQMIELLHLPEKFPGLDDDRPAWDLLQDAEKWQSEMTAVVQAKLEKSI